MFDNREFVAHNVRQIGFFYVVYGARYDSNIYASEYSLIDMGY